MGAARKCSKLAPMKGLVLIVLLMGLRIGYAQETPVYQLLWEITGKKLSKPSYVFGSMHSNDPRLFQFPDSLYTAFVQSDAVVSETDVRAIYDQYDVRISAFNLDLFEKNRSFNASREASTTVYGDEDGRPQFLDAYFQHTAHCAGKQFYQLETLQEQLDAANNLDPGPRAALNAYFFSKEKFTDTYLQGDIAALSRMLRSQLQSTPGAYESLITQRNRNMVQGLDTLMRKQAVFCVVGSGHLYGNDGIIPLLRAKGYTVRPIQATFDGTTATEKKQMQAWRRYEVSDSDFLFSIVLSGKPLETKTTDSYNFVYQELGQGNGYELAVSKTPVDLDRRFNEFLKNQHTTPVDSTTADGTRIMEGLILDPVKGYQWKRFIAYNGITYELTCYGGNKFMHSDRPKAYFDRLILKP